MKAPICVEIELSYPDPSRYHVYCTMSRQPNTQA